MSQPLENPESGPNYVMELHSEEPPSEAVINAVAEVTDRSPFEMKPLAEVIDPDALDAFITRTDENASSVTATFDYCGCHVLVTPSEIQIDL